MQDLKSVIRNMSDLELEDLVHLVGMEEATRNWHKEYAPTPFDAVTVETFPDIETMTAACFPNPKVTTHTHKFPAKETHCTVCGMSRKQVRAYFESLQGTYVEKGV